VLFNCRGQIAEMALKHRLPAAGGGPEWRGLLLSYGSDLRDLFRRTADIVDKIFKGAKPADLPVVQSARFALVINLQTAKSLGLTVPPTLLATADEVIE
jgi:putative ABC transport system substrate-binding protein